MLVVSGEWLVVRVTGGSGGGDGGVVCAGEGGLGNGWGK